jgi:Protein-tyrosine phosphatase.
MVTRTFDFIRVGGSITDEHDFMLLITTHNTNIPQVMCVQYWPAGKHREEVYCGVGVTVENEEQLANFMIRTLKLRWVSQPDSLSVRVWESSMQGVIKIKYAMVSGCPFSEW